MKTITIEGETRHAQRTFAESRLQSFNDRLTVAYTELFDRPEYARAKASSNPAKLAREMTLGLVQGVVSKDGPGVIRVCNELGIRHTYKALRAFLNGQ